MPNDAAICTLWDVGGRKPSDFPFTSSRVLNRGAAALAMACLVAVPVHAADTGLGAVPSLSATSPPPASASSPPVSTAKRPDWSRLGRQSDAWFASDEGRRLMVHVVSHQSARGDWPKNIDTTASAQSGDPSKIQGTFDNGATVGELRFLARAHRVTHDPVVADAVVRGLRHILAAQYPSGGWPQSHPPGKGYARHITFNDGTMVNLMELMRDVVRSESFDWVSAPTKQEAQAAFDRAIVCVLNCQIRVNGTLTVWCAQHDANTLEPRPARTYEMISLSGAESAGILRFLMTIEKPSSALADAIRAGVAWFAVVPLKGLRWVDRAGDRIVIEDPEAPWLWARFYEISTNRPLFAGRDGVVKYAVSDIERERRTGYAWYGRWGEDVARDFSVWVARQNSR